MRSTGDKSVVLPILRDGRFAASSDEVNLLKHNTLMLRSERRERLEAWAASDSPIAHRQQRLASDIIAQKARSLGRAGASS
jgi:hypothetical protein